MKWFELDAPVYLFRGEGFVYRAAVEEPATWEAIAAALDTLHAAGRGAVPCFAEAGDAFGADTLAGSCCLLVAVSLWGQRGAEVWV
jgi:hypothetical protein